MREEGTCLQSNSSQKGSTALALNVGFTLWAVQSSAFKPELSFHEACLNVRGSVKDIMFK